MDNLLLIKQSLLTMLSGLFVFLFGVWDMYCRKTTMENSVATVRNEINAKLGVNTDWIDLKKSPYRRNNLF